MPTHNAENERIKRRYFAFYREAKRRSEPSVDAVAKAISRFETYNRFKSFKGFHIEQAIAFKRDLAEQTNARTGRPLAKATILSTLSALKAFFVWLAGQPGYRSTLSYSDGDYFNLSERDSRIARERLEKPVPSLEQVRHVILSMPAGDVFERRDRALVAFILLTGARHRAVVSFKLKHLDLVEGCVVQDAREVSTKFGKSFRTWFFPVGDDIRKIVEEWAAFLSRDLLWGPDDPLFPATRMDVGPDRRFHPTGLERRHLASAGPVREIFRRAFTAAGLPYFPPHRLRNTLAVLSQRMGLTVEETKAWSQNLGHSDVLTTLMSYGEVPSVRQAELIRGLGRPKKTRAEALGLLDDLKEALRERG